MSKIPLLINIYIHPKYLYLSLLAPYAITFTWQLSYIMHVPADCYLKNRHYLADLAHFIFMATDPKWALNIAMDSHHIFKMKSPLQVFFKLTLSCLPTFPYLYPSAQPVQSLQLKRSPIGQPWYQGSLFSPDSKGFHSSNYSLDFLSINS